MSELLVQPQEAVWLRAELLAAGHTDRELAALVRAGVLHRVRRGAYVDRGSYDGADVAGRHRVLAQAVSRQSKTRLIISHCSAVPFHDGPTWRLPLDVAHVTRPDGRAGRAEAGVRQHRGALLEGDIVVRQGIEVMSATRTALEVATCASTEASLVVVNDFLRRKLTTIDSLRDRYRPMVHDPFTGRVDLVLRLADARLGSVAESRTFFLCYRGGIPRPEPQHELRDTNGDLLAQLDFAWPELGVWLEFDGREKYVKHLRKGESVVDAVLREKQRESMIMEITGWRCIRITWADLERPSATVARILAMLGVASRVTSVSS